MPSSTFAAISPIMEAVAVIDPTTVLDVGCGNGKYGFLCREYGEMWRNKKMVIDAIEGFDGYIHDLQKLIYNDIFNGDARFIVTNAGWNYDLVLAIDILEHMNENDGKAFMRSASIIGKSVIVCTPLALKAQGAVGGNEYERHVRQWGAEEIRKGLGKQYNAVHVNEEENFVIVVASDKDLK